MFHVKHLYESVTARVDARPHSPVDPPCDPPEPACAPPALMRGRGAVTYMKGPKAYASAGGIALFTFSRMMSQLLRMALRSS